MTREEAREGLIGYSLFIADGTDLKEALNMAIEALQAEPNKAVPPSLADVYKWERDIALSQLEEYGIGFAEKKRDDLVEVVRCKDCRHIEVINTENTYAICHEHDIIFEPFEDSTKTNFCSWGERREK